MQTHIHTYLHIGAIYLNNLAYVLELKENRGTWKKPTWTQTLQDQSWHTGRVRWQCYQLCYHTAHDKSMK